MSVEEIILIVRCIKVILCTTLAVERFAVADLLKIVQAAGNAFVTVAVEGVQVDGCSAVNAGVYFGALQDRLSVRIHDAGCGRTVGVDEVCVLIGFIVRPFQIAVTEGCLDGSKGRNGFAVAIQLALTFLIGRLDRGVDLRNGCGIGLRNDEGDTKGW